MSSDTADTEGDRADTEGDITVTSADFLGFIIAAGLTDVEAGFTDVNGTSATFMDFVYAAGLVDTGLTDTEAGITDLSTGGTEDFARVEVDFEGSMDNLRLLFGFSGAREASATFKVVFTGRDVDVGDFKGEGGSMGFLIGIGMDSLLDTSLKFRFSFFLGRGLSSKESLILTLLVSAYFLLSLPIETIICSI